MMCIFAMRQCSWIHMKKTHSCTLYGWCNFLDSPVCTGCECPSSCCHPFQILHSMAVDTSIVFPHRLGPPHKLELHHLTAEYLRRIIQESGTFSWLCPGRNAGGVDFSFYGHLKPGFGLASFTSKPDLECLYCICRLFMMKNVKLCTGKEWQRTCLPLGYIFYSMMMLIGTVVK